MDDKTLQMYAKGILELKEQEEVAKRQRQILEAQMAAMVATKDEGTDKACAGRYRITVTSKLNRALDYDAYQAVEAQIPEGLRCVRMKPEIDLAKLRAMDLARPGFSAQFVTTKPAKPAVKIEELEEAA